MVKLAVFGFIMLAAALNVRAGESPDTLQAFHLNEVIVTGSNTIVGRNLLPYTVTTVGRQQLEATGSTQLLSAISGLVPSLFVTQRNIFGFGVSNGGSGHIKMRGVGGDRASAVLMMVDGQPQFAGLYSHHVADFYGIESVERVEVLRGPASVLYGSNAMAGVINVITKNARQEGTHTGITVQYGSYNTLLTSITNTNRYGRFSSLVSAGYNRTDGLKENFDFSQLNGYVKIGYDFSDNWSTYADYSLMTFTGNDPIYPAIKGQQGVYQQKVIRGEGSVVAVNKYRKTNGVARAYYSYGNHFIHDPNYFHSLDDRLGFIIYQNFNPWRGACATAGFDFDRYTGKIPISGGKNHQQAPLATLERKAIIEYSPYITLQQKLWHDRIVLNAGVRMANSNMFGVKMIPQAGFVIAPGKGWTLKASVAKGYRNPSFRELFLYKFANPYLLPESMMNYEVCIGKNLGRYLSIDLTGYCSRGSNIIQQTATINENTGSFINNGIELAARSHPIEQLSLWASYSYLHTSVTALTGAPKHQYYIGVGWDAFKKFHVDTELKGVAKLFVADDVDVQNYALLNMRVSYQLIKQVQLTVNIDNLTNTQYIINKGYPMPGITAMGGVKISF